MKTVDAVLDALSRQGVLPNGTTAELTGGVLLEKIRPLLPATPASTKDTAVHQYISKFARPSFVAAALLASGFAVTTLANAQGHTPTACKSDWACPKNQACSSGVCAPRTPSSSASAAPSTKSPLPAKLPPAWIKDGAGCKVWDENPVQGQEVQWSGKCVAGKASGPGTLEVREHGNVSQRIECAFRNGRPHGRGKVTWLDIDGATTLETTFVDGTIDGNGVLTMANGTIEQGPYVKGVKHGLFGIKFPDGTELYGEYDHGEQTPSLRSKLAQRRQQRRSEQRAAKAEAQQRAATEPRRQAVPKRRLSNPDDARALQAASSKYTQCISRCAQGYKQCFDDVCRESQFPIFGRSAARAECIQDKCTPSYHGCQDACEASFNAEGFCVAHSTVTGERTGSVGPCPE